MSKGLVVIFVIGLVILPIAVFGCKGKVDIENEEMSTEAMVPVEEVVVTQTLVTEPDLLETVSQETIPPTAAVPPAQQPATAALTDRTGRGIDIQIALKAAGLYDGNIDGKIGPKTKKAIIEFQRAKGLKTDGKVGPKTWAELEKYLQR